VIKEVSADVDAEAGEIILFTPLDGWDSHGVALPRRRRGQRDSSHRTSSTAVRQLVLIANDELIAGILNLQQADHGPPWQSLTRNA